MVERTRTRRTRYAGVAAVLALIGSLLGVQPAVADADSTVEVGITQTDAATQQSGRTFDYRLSYSCSNLDNVVCGQDPVIAIPLGDAADMAIDVADGPAIASWEVVGGELRIHLEDLGEGSAGTIDFTVLPPNGTTPDGTSWTLRPTLSFGDGVTPTATAPSAVTSTATATATLDVDKTTLQLFYRPGDQVVYDLEATCGTASVGRENMTSITLVDTLPAGLTFVSADPTPTSVVGQVVTFTLGAADAGGLCDTRVRLTAAVDGDIADGTTLDNTVTASGVSLSGASAGPASDDQSITVVDAFTGGSGGKTGIGPVVDGNGNFAATYPGPWLGTGIAQDRDGRSLTNATYGAGDVEATYSLQVEMPTSGLLEHEVVDAMPCYDNVVGPIYYSNDVGDLCQDPAFNPTMVTIDTLDRGVDPDYLPQARLVDGTLVDLEAGPVRVPENALGLIRYRSYYVPTAHLGAVAELVFPRAATMTNRTTDYIIAGYSDEKNVGGEVLRNRFQLESFEAGDADPYATSLSGFGSVNIVSGPQIGIQKWAVPEESRFELSATLTVADFSQLSAPLTIIDRLPAGLALSGAVTAVEAYESTTGTLLDLTMTTTSEVDPVTGETVVTMQVPLAQFVEAVGTVGIWALSIDVPVSWEFGGTYVNVAEVALNDADVNDTACREGDPVPGTSGVTFACRAEASMEVLPDPSSDAVQVFKTVRGSEDDDFLRNPAIGAVSEDGGPVAYRLNWTNKSAAEVGDVVLYDLLPTPGDTGTLAANTGQRRGSTFTPELVGLAALPAGVSVEYSRAGNPCRDEVFPDAQNTACVDDWSAVAPGDLSSVTALRFVSTATYAFDEGFVIELHMTAPEIATPRDIAWNTFAAAQTNLDTDEAIRPVESARVGLARPDFVDGDPELTFAKTSDPAPGTAVEPGDEITYSVTIANDGDRPATASSVTDDMSEVLDKASLVDPPTISCAPAANSCGEVVYAAGEQSFVWQATTDAPLAPHTTATVTYAVAVDDDATGAVRNHLVEPDVWVEHPILAALRWDKVGAAGAGLLSGAEWELTPVDAAGAPSGAVVVVVDCVQGPCAGADVDPAGGRFLVTGLVPGEYRLVETRAPVGFVVDATPVRVTVSGTVAVTVLEDIVNHPQSVPVLPFTGGWGVDQLVLVGGGLLVVMIGLGAWQLRRRRHTA